MIARRIVQADSAFEAVLGLVLVFGAAAAWLGSDDFPAPVVLWRLAAAPTRFLRTLAAANLTTAAAACTWRLVADGFSTAGSALIVSTAAALAVLAAAQLLADR